MKKPINKMSSQELCGRYLNGDKRITLKMIKDKEHSEYFNTSLQSWSFGKSYLEPIVIFPMSLYLIFKIDPFVFLAMGFMIYQFFKA